MIGWFQFFGNTAFTLGYIDGNIEKSRYITVDQETNVLSNYCKKTVDTAIWSKTNWRVSNVFYNFPFVDSMCKCPTEMLQNILKNEGNL